MTFARCLIGSKQSRGVAVVGEKGYLHFSLINGGGHDRGGCESPR